MGFGGMLGVYLKAISSSGSLLLLLLLYFQGGEIITGASAASSSSSSPSIPPNGMEGTCDKLVMVETVESLSYLGNVTFAAPSAYKGNWTTVIKFTSPFTFIGGWGVTVQSFGRKSYAIFERNEEENLKKGDQVIFQFRVLYGYGVKKAPKVLSIKWQDKIICGPPITPDSKLRKTFAKLHLESSEEEMKDEPIVVADDVAVVGNQDKVKDVIIPIISPASGPSNSEKVKGEAELMPIQQHVSTNKVRFNFSKWKPTVKKD